MSTPEESPAQRAARLRRERREAKIKEGGSARLDKITKTSGRTHQSTLEEPSPSPQPSPSPEPDMQSPETLQAQQDYIRAMLRQSAPEPGHGAQAEDVEDPTVKLLNSLLGATPGKADAADQSPGQTPGFSPADIASALGLPPSIGNMLGVAVQPPTEEEQKTMRVWKALHIVFTLCVAVYFLFIIDASVAAFGSNPPKPATFQNPLVLFVTGEMLLIGSRVLLGKKQGGLGMAVQLLRDVVRDGSLVLFVLGMGSWYYREWQTVGK